MTVHPANQHERATSKPVHIPTVLAIGCSDAMLARCWDAIAGIGVMVRDCEPALAATLVATRKPLVIVMPDVVGHAASGADLAADPARAITPTPILSASISCCREKPAKERR